MPAEQIAQQLAQAQAQAEADPDEDAALELWAEHEVAFKVFRAMKTQWRVATGAGGRLVHTGLDYSVLPVVEQRLKVQLDEAGLGQLHVMETTAADILND